jgi:hypothetical protein
MKISFSINGNKLWGWIGRVGNAEDTKKFAEILGVIEALK